MPATKEITVLMDDQPGALGKVCRALAGHSVNIVAFQSFPVGGKSLTRFVFDNPTAAKSALESERLTHFETDIAQVKLPHRPGELGRAATRLGEAGININYTYCGVEPTTNATLVFFGVTDVAKAVPILDQTAAAAKALERAARKF